ncbi:hypothetical protein [Evansella cellulosilytica]|uniref:DUF3828 domain-containing protein n=1 Tax=Evansella cellulosilytica (strain ATCC 21833 / DSM 2522 / FERM P-1141 / JCM 9156 / N-4) TaxID=649639 RepID=E6TR09_EVAC2|nr:hypothetical protein [Evansella cellulosilytica]ADU29385.1 hypothetical protein Bcell_1115 [Evansella cellulosilytica DSM 2522]
MKLFFPTITLFSMLLLLGGCNEDTATTNTPEVNEASIISTDEMTAEEFVNHFYTHYLDQDYKMVKEYLSPTYLERHGVTANDFVSALEDRDFRSNIEFLEYRIANSREIDDHNMFFRVSVKSNYNGNEQVDDDELVVFREDGDWLIDPDGFSSFDTFDNTIATEQLSFEDFEIHTRNRVYGQDVHIFFNWEINLPNVSLFYMADSAVSVLTDTGEVYTSTRSIDLHSIFEPNRVHEIALEFEDVEGTPTQLLFENLVLQDENGDPMIIPRETLEIIVDLDEEFISTSLPLEGVSEDIIMEAFENERERLNQHNPELYQLESVTYLDNGYWKGEYLQTASGSTTSTLVNIFNGTTRMNKHY